MAYNKYRDFEINEEKTAAFLENAVTKINTGEDIDTLSTLIKLFKKNVPLSRRKYVTAYLLKEALKHYHYFAHNNKSSKNANQNRNPKHDYKSSQRVERSLDVENNTTETEEQPRHPRVEIDPDKATSIFISIGKNRRVYPRDLVGILIAIAGLDRDRIGDIKVLANYSFVQLYTEDADIAIEKLNGYEYRGRILAVSYSRQKDDDSASDLFVGDENLSDDDSLSMTEEDAAAYAAAEKAAADKTPFGNL